MANIPQLGLRVFQLFMAVLIMALIGNAIAMGAAPAINNYTMFCAAFAMLSLFALIPMALGIFESLGFVAFGLDLLNVIFWFCAAVALAAELGVHSCNNDGYVSTNKVMRGASNRSGACREAQASTAFLWFGWVAFVASCALSGMSMRSSGGVRGGGIRPAMSQRSAA